MKCLSQLPPALFLGLALASCSRPPAPPPAGHPNPTEAPRFPLTLTIVGTNDLHGHIESAPVLSGFLRALRDAKGRSSVILLDAGDMFQGTIESGLGEGAPVVRAYNALGYDAAAVGNHEFDFGPEGPLMTAKSDADDPRGAIKARSAEARFPFLSANIVDARSGQIPAWPNLHARATLVREGVTIALVGVATEDTPHTTIAANFAGLKVTPLADAIVREANAARREGATVVVVVAHAGGKCARREEPRSVSTCDPSEEIMRTLQAVPPGTIDAVVAGHTHSFMANEVFGVPIVESVFGGKAFGRIDLTIDRATKRVTSHVVLPTTELRLPAVYEGRAVARDEELAATLAPDVERARSRKEARVGVVLDDTFEKSHDFESAEGNLFADLMRTSVPGADIAITNGGGLRADLPAGELRYGQLFEAMPFDNRFAIVRFNGRALRKLVAANMSTKSGIFSVSGFRVRAECRGAQVDVTLSRTDGRLIRDDDPVVLVTTDFLATGGDGNRFPKDSVTIDETLVRDALEAGLRARGGHLSRKDASILDPAQPRIAVVGTRPLKCKD